MSDALDDNIFKDNSKYEFLEGNEPINELHDMIHYNYIAIDKLNKRVIDLLEEIKTPLNQELVMCLEEIKYLRAKHMIITNRIEVIEHERSPY